MAKVPMSLHGELHDAPCLEPPYDYGQSDASLRCLRLPLPPPDHLPLRVQVSLSKPQSPGDPSKRSMVAPGQENAAGRLPFSPGTNAFEYPQALGLVAGNPTVPGAIPTGPGSALVQKSALIDRVLLQPETLSDRLPSDLKSLARNPAFIRDLRSALLELSPKELAQPSAIAARVREVVARNLKFSAEPPPLPDTPRVLGSKGPRASIAYAGSGQLRVGGQWVQPLWIGGGVAAGLTAQTEQPQGSRAALPVTGSAAIGFFHDVVPGSLAVFAGAGGSVGNSRVETTYGTTQIATPKQLQLAAVGTLGPVVTVEGRVTPRGWPVGVRVDATAFLPMATTSALDFAGQQARGQSIDVRNGLQAQLGVTISSRDIPLGSMRLTPFARAEIPITGGGQPTVYAGFELGRSRNGPIPPSQPTPELSTPELTLPPPNPNAPTPTEAAPTTRPLPTVSSPPHATPTGAAALGGPITLDRS
jgi:hypothetical protein